MSVRFRFERNMHERLLPKIQYIILKQFYYRSNLQSIFQILVTFLSYIHQFYSRANKLLSIFLHDSQLCKERFCVIYHLTCITREEIIASVQLSRVSIKYEISY